MALSEIDRNLIQRCLAHKPKAWEDFVDRFMGLIIHVINHTAQCRSIRLTQEDRDDLASEVFLTLVRDDFAVLQRFRGASSLATYLTVVARRVVVDRLLRHRSASPLGADVYDTAGDGNQVQQRISDREQVDQLLGELEEAEAAVVRMYHLEGKTYREISVATGMPENSVGPTLSRARNKMRRSGADQTTGRAQ
ncbi:MAG: RNA polymerase subunit sigma-70 [Planctomycetes bacterium RBG_16_64_10]|nr:MAG: RNA polymerase subunit sigma-70 [Planctomycetes bacterium RBG_16_64_10]